MELLIVGSLIIWVPLALAIGHHRGWNLLHAALLGALLGPIGLLIIALVTGPNPTTTEREDARQREYWRRYFEERAAWEARSQRPARAGRRR